MHGYTSKTDLLGGLHQHDMMKVECELLQSLT